MTPLGAILAGGESRRYGAPKALAEVGGARIIDRVIVALGAVCDDLVLIANEPELFADLALPTRPDDRPGLGALGGIHTALRWAVEEGRPGVLAVACDMPFLSVALLERLREGAFGTATPDGPDLVVPASRSRRGVEPLCAAYGTGCLPAIEAEFGRGESHIVGFYDDVSVDRIPLEEVARLCDPAVAFMNVNTREERDRADALVSGSGSGSGSVSGSGSGSGSGSEERRKRISGNAERDGTGSDG
ncbi:MAG TPA: molybdenum cofactor guanylyltransferase [Longimicrobiales bacterium]|nr:molybdenum cofactor guanylyltransferase [Longimicrobiales bacterium]